MGKTKVIWFISLTFLCLLGIGFFFFSDYAVVLGDKIEEFFIEKEPWQITNPAEEEMEGYASPISLKAGENLDLFIKSKRPFRIEFYRVGYENGKSATLTGKIDHLPAQHQTAKPDPVTMDANWKKTTTYKIPENWKSGFYLGKLIDSDGEETFIPFIIHEENPKATFGVMISTNTYQAYNNWGGKSLYPYNSTNHKEAEMVSFNRPFVRGNGAGDFFEYEYPLVRWLEKKGYSVTYFSDTDVHNGILDRAQINGLIIPGHDEYWSKNMRDSIENHIHKGMNLGLFSANTGYWQVRLENQNRLMVCYRTAEQDPILTTNPAEVTTRYRSEWINRPEDELLGAMYQGVPDKNYPLVIGNTDHWIFQGTTLKKGDKIPGVIGGEIDNNSRKLPHVKVLISSPVYLKGLPRPQSDTKAQHDIHTRHTTSDVVIIEKPDQGMVFSTGTFRWQLSIEPFQKVDVEYNKNMEQMTINVMERLKVRKQLPQ